MFQITPQTFHAFTFAEVLIMAAMNVESIRLNLNGRVAVDSAGTPNKLVMLFVQGPPKHRNCKR